MAESRCSGPRGHLEYVNCWYKWYSVGAQRSRRSCPASHSRVLPRTLFYDQKIRNVIRLYAIQNHTICCLISRTVRHIYRKSKRGVLNTHKYIIKPWLTVIIFQINEPALWESEAVPYFIHNRQMKQRPLKSWSGKLLPIPTRTDRNILVNKKNLF